MTNSEKRALVEECRKSGMTAKEWCASKGINYHSYTHWASKINKEAQVLFADTKKGAQSSAIVYSIVESAKANKINPYMYLVHIFQTMPSLDFKDDPTLLESLMPWSPELPDYCRL